LEQQVWRWDNLPEERRLFWLTLVDVIGEIERERQPLHVLTVAPDGSQSVRIVRPLELDERPGDGRFTTNETTEWGEGLGPEPGILAPRVTDLARAHLRPKPQK
jgi:hypothetical protein